MAYWLYCKSCQQWSKSPIPLEDDLYCSFCGNLFIDANTNIKPFPEKEIRTEPGTREEGIVPGEEPAIAEETVFETFDISDPVEDGKVQEIQAYSENGEKLNDEATEDTEQSANSNGEYEQTENKPDADESEALEEREGQQNPPEADSSDSCEETSQAEDQDAVAIAVDVPPAQEKRKREKFQERVRRMRTPK